LDCKRKVNSWGVIMWVSSWSPTSWISSDAITFVESRWNWRPNCGFQGDPGEDGDMKKLLASGCKERTLSEGKQLSWESAHFNVLGQGRAATHRKLCCSIHPLWQDALRLVTTRQDAEVLRPGQSRRQHSHPLLYLKSADLHSFSVSISPSRISLFFPLSSLWDYASPTV
jgi:hypothetical protein